MTTEKITKRYPAYWTEEDMRQIKNGYRIAHGHEPSDLMTDMMGIKQCLNYIEISSTKGRSLSKPIPTRTLIFIVIYGIAVTIASVWLAIKTNN